MAVSLKPLETTNLRSQIASNLREAIYRGDFRPGESIQEAMVASQLRVSRAPVREAILLLEKEGLVTVQANRGAVIRSLTQAELAEIMSMRYRLESWALELARPKVTPEIMAELRELHARMLEAAGRGDVRAFTNTDFAFHKLVWETGDNALLAETLQRIAGPVFAFADIVLSQAGFDCSRLAELHHPIIAYLAGETEARPEDVLRDVFEYTFQSEWDVLFRDKERR
ncbi:MAG TPA: GntR family transcriptional regulator [Bryobacteraceae bacterium]|nr:GntR family transcriptional regulator [Bryobacteraceae bacterium]